MKQKVELFCTGTHIGSSNQKLIGFIVLDEEGQPTDKELVYLASKFKGCYVGQVYNAEMKFGKDSTVIYGRPDYVRTHGDDEFILEHRINSEANETILTFKKQSQKEAREKTDIMAQLEPLRRAYQRTNMQGKVAMEARVLYYLRRGEDL